MLGKIGNSLRKAAHFIGKGTKYIVKQTQKGLDFADKATDFVGKGLKNIKKDYTRITEGAIEALPGFVRPLAREAKFGLEASPIGVVVGDAFKQASLIQKQSRDILDSREVRAFRSI